MKKNEYHQMQQVEDTHWWFVGKKMYVSTLMHSLISRKKLMILDVGCGTGGMTKFLQGFGNVTGVEYDSTAYRYCKRKKINVIPGSANKLPLSNKSFDAVTFFDVLYHKHIDEDKAVQEAHRVLNPNGLLIVTDCALPFFWSSHDENMMAKKRFLKNELEDLLKKHGFSIQRSSYIFFFLFPIFALQRLLLKMKADASKSTVYPPPKLINFLLIWLMKIETTLFSYFGSFPVGSSILILAKKNDKFPH